MNPWSGRRVAFEKKQGEQEMTPTSVGLQNSFEKNSELPEDHPERKMKGRSVFLGNNVRD